MARAVEVARKMLGFKSVIKDEVLVINSEGDTQSVEDIVASLVIEDKLAQAQEQPRRIKIRKTLFNVFFNHLYIIIVHNMQCTLISGTILVTDDQLSFSL